MTETGIGKSNVGYAIIGMVWVLCLLHFNPKLMNVLNTDDSLVAKVVFSAFVCFINLFWLYGILHLFFLFHRLIPKKEPILEKISDFPSVAILYTTRNDFQLKAVESCLKQSYPNFHVYILDDSTEPYSMELVDAFFQANSEHCTVVRRESRHGFKAGNLNNALSRHVTEQEYFAVIDADEVLPHDFLKRLLPYFKIDESIAFVQASHEHNPQQPSGFARDLAMGIDFHWDVYQPPRNRHGFVVFYGHGAVIRRDVWEKVGGFPEIVSEDLAFSTRIRKMGYRGYFAREVVCYEDFPENYQQFRKRQEKWVQGGCEYLHREFLPFLVARGVTLAEKVDVLLSLFVLFIPALFLLFLFIANAFLPLLLAEKHSLSITLLGKTVHLMPAYFLEPKFRELWTLDFYLITIVGMFSPIFCYFCRIFLQPGKIGRLLLKSAVPYISLILVATCGIFNYVFTKRAVFLATGDKSGDCLKRFNANHPLIFHSEWMLGLILTYFSLMTVNPALLTISTCLILSPVIARFGWENRVVSFLVFLPLFFVVLAFGCTGMGFLGFHGFSLYLLALHF